MRKVAHVVLHSRFNQLLLSVDAGVRFGRGPAALQILQQIGRHRTGHPGPWSRRISITCVNGIYVDQAGDDGQKLPLNGPSVSEEALREETQP